MRRIIFFRLILPEIEQKVLLALNMLRVVMIEPPQVQVLLTHVFLSEHVSILLIHDIQNIERWFAMQLLSAELQLAEGSVGPLNHVFLVPCRDLRLMLRLWKGRRLHDWMFVKSLWRVVFQEVSCHRFHKLNYFATGSIVGENCCDFVVEILVVEKPFEERVVLFLKGFNHVLKHGQLLKVYLFLVLLRQEQIACR